jgi:hypothetical protein
MVHLLPLPGAPGYEGSMDSVLDRAVADARAIRDGGAAGIVVENFGDKPFFKAVGVETVAAMSRLVSEVARETALPVGVNVLRNDGAAAVAIAVACGVAVNVHTGAMLTDQGIIEGDAAAVLRLRDRLGGCGVAIFADYMVKHAVPLGPVDEAVMAKDLRYRGLADAIVVSGKETGGEADPGLLRGLRDLLPDAPLVLGSGLNAGNASHFRGLADAAIVGTSIKAGGQVDAPVDPSRVRAVVDAFSR